MGRRFTASVATSMKMGVSSDVAASRRLRSGMAEDVHAPRILVVTSDCIRSHTHAIKNRFDDMTPPPFLVPRPDQATQPSADTARGPAARRAIVKMTAALVTGALVAGALVFSIHGFRSSLPTHTGPPVHAAAVMQTLAVSVATPTVAPPTPAAAPIEVPQPLMVAHPSRKGRSVHHVAARHGAAARATKKKPVEEELSELGEQQLRQAL